MTRFSNGHQKVPVHLVSQRDKSHGIAIYYNGEGVFNTDFSISGTDTSVVLEQTSPSKTAEIIFTGKSIDQFQTEINVSNMPFKAVALTEAINLTTGELVFNTSEPNYDGGYFGDLKRHIVKYNEQTKLSAGGVTAISRKTPWYPIVNIGKVSKNINGKNYIFEIPEYENQSWHPVYGRPYREVTSPLTFISDKKYGIVGAPIYYRNNNVKISMSNGLDVQDIVKDVDENNGIIYLKNSLPYGSSPTAHFTAKQNGYIYKEVNLNPAIEHNPGMAGRYLLLYLKPTKINPEGIERKRSVYHKISNGLLTAINSIPDEGEPILILGGYHIRQTNTYKDTNILDTRSRGGGIKEDQYDEALEENKNAYSVSDLGFIDGVSYPGSTAIVAEIPESLKDVMTVAQIKAKLNKFITLGVTTLPEFK